MSKKKIPTRAELIKKGVPAVLIPGIIFAAIYGVRINQIKNYYEDERMFPRRGVATEIEDGDTFELDGGQKVRMIGIDAPNRGEEGSEESKKVLQDLVKNRRVWLEYDRYQDDKYGRILAWIWLDCESSEPNFLEADYMRLNGRQSREYVLEKPKGCLSGELVNKTLVEKGVVKSVEYEKRGRLKYDLGRLQ